MKKDEFNITKRNVVFMVENKEKVELVDEELDKVNGGNNTSTAQSLIEEFESRIEQNSSQSFTSKKNQGTSIDFIVPIGRKN